MVQPLTVQADAKNMPKFWWMSVGLGLFATVFLVLAVYQTIEGEWILAGVLAVLALVLTGILFTVIKASRCTVTWTGQELRVHGLVSFTATLQDMVALQWGKRRKGGFGMVILQTNGLRRTVGPAAFVREEVVAFVDAVNKDLDWVESPVAPSKQEALTLAAAGAILFGVVLVALGAAARGTEVVARLLAPFHLSGVELLVLGVVSTMGGFIALARARRRHA